MNPPCMTREELEQFLKKVERWHTIEQKLVHTHFDREAKAFISSAGYEFEYRKPKAGQPYYVVVKK